MSEIAVIGAGFAGLACAKHLVDLGFTVKVFDSQAIGESASGIATGLLHGYHGPHASPSWEWKQAYTHTLTFFQKIQKTSPINFYHPIHLIRPAKDSEQAQKWTKQSLKYPEDLTYETETSEFPFGYLKVHKAFTIDVQSYLKALEKHLLEKGVIFEKKYFQPLDDASKFTHVIICCGALSAAWPQLEAFNLKALVGQLYEFQNSHQIEHMATVSRYYFSPDINSNTIKLGGTYEKIPLDFSALTSTLYPPCDNHYTQSMIEEASQLDRRIKMHKNGILKAGLRGYRSTHLPLVGHIKDNLWICSSFGSKGILYHSWLSELLVNHIYHHQPLYDCISTKK